MSLLTRCGPPGLIAMALLSTCGGDDEGEGLRGEQARVAQTVRALSDAYRSRDARTVCRLTVPNVLLSPADASTRAKERRICERDFRRHKLFELGASVEGTVSEVTVSNGRATVRLEAKDGRGSPTIIRLAKLDGEWKIVTLAG